jgi:hypothetical protein
VGSRNHEVGDSLLGAVWARSQVSFQLESTSGTIEAEEKGP